jgi:hypothetical protein
VTSAGIAPVADARKEPKTMLERLWSMVKVVQFDNLTLFGLFAVTAMLVCYALESRSRWYVLGFAVACALGSAYGFLQGAWPFGLVEVAWAVVAVRRWQLRQKSMRLQLTRRNRLPPVGEESCDFRR